MEIDQDTLAVLNDFEYGDTSSHGMSSPHGMGLHQSRWLVVGGGIFDSSV